MAHSPVRLLPTSAQRDPMKPSDPPFRRDLRSLSTDRSNPVRFRNKTKAHVPFPFSRYRRGATVQLLPFLDAHGRVRRASVGRRRIPSASTCLAWRARSWKRARVILGRRRRTWHVPTPPNRWLRWRSVLRTRLVGRASSTRSRRKHWCRNGHVFGKWRSRSRRRKQRSRSWNTNWKSWITNWSNENDSRARRNGSRSLVRTARTAKEHVIENGRRTPASEAREKNSSPLHMRHWKHRRISHTCVCLARRDPGRIHVRRNVWKDSFANPKARRNRSKRRERHGTDVLPLVFQAQRPKTQWNWCLRTKKACRKVQAKGAQEKEIMEAMAAGCAEVRE